MALISCLRAYCDSLYSMQSLGWIRTIGSMKPYEVYKAAFISMPHAGVSLDRFADGSHLGAFLRPLDAGRLTQETALQRGIVEGVAPEAERSVKGVQAVWKCGY